MVEYAWLLVTTVMILSFIFQRYYLSPTAIFIGYSTVVIPIAYLVSKALDIPSVFFVSHESMPADGVLAACLATVLGVGGFFLGRYLIPTPTLSWPKLNIITRRIKWLVFASFGVAIISAGLLVRELGGIDRIFTEMGSIRSGELKGLGVQVYAVTMLLPSVMQLWLISSIRNGSKHVYVILVGCLATSMMGGLLGFRGPVLALLIQVTGIWFLLTGRPTRKILLLILFLAVPLSTLFSFIRVLTDEAAMKYLQRVDSTAIYAYVFDAALTRVRGVESFILMKNYIDTCNYNFFVSNFLETFLSVVPSFVVNKDISVTELIATTVYSTSLFDAGIIKDVYGGVAYTYIAEGYWNLGFLGVVLFTTILGILFKIVEDMRYNVLPSNVQIIFYKAIAGFALLVVEAPQLGINAIVVNVFANFILLALLSVPILPIAREKVWGNKSHK